MWHACDYYATAVTIGGMSVAKVRVHGEFLVPGA